MPGRKENSKEICNGEREIQVNFICSWEWMLIKMRVESRGENFTGLLMSFPYMEKKSWLLEGVSTNKWGLGKVGLCMFLLRLYIKRGSW